MNGYTTYEAGNTCLWIDNTYSLQYKANEILTNINQFTELTPCPNWTDQYKAELLAHLFMMHLEKNLMTHTGDGVKYTLENLTEYFINNL